MASPAPPSDGVTFEAAHAPITLNVVLRARDECPEYVHMFETQLTGEQQLRAVAYLRGVEFAAERSFRVVEHSIAAGVDRITMKFAMSDSCALAGMRALVAMHADGEL